MLGRRIGHANYLDLREVAYDLVTLGFVTRPWDSARFGRSGRVFAYYDIDGFEPDAYQPGYPNPAFSRASERDLAWTARIVARFSPAHIQALVRTARFEDPLLERELERILLGRQQKIFRRYLTGLSPLTDPELGRNGGTTELCLRDLGLHTGVVLPAARGYTVRIFTAEGLSFASARRAGEHRVCTDLPAVPGATILSPGYLIVDLAAGVRGVELQPPSRVHLYHLGGDQYRIVGLERPDSPEPPGQL